MRIVEFGENRERPREEGRISLLPPPEAGHDWHLVNVVKSNWLLFCKLVFHIL